MDLYPGCNDYFKIPKKTLGPLGVGIFEDAKMAAITENYWNIKWDKIFWIYQNVIISHLLISLFELLIFHNEVVSL